MFRGAFDCRPRCPRQSPRDATASSLRGATRWNERLHRSASGTSSPGEAATQSGSTTMFRRVAARSTRSRANSRHVPHPSPAPSRSATRSANDADAPVSGSEANAVAASTSSRSVTRLQRQTYTAWPIRLSRERIVNENDWNLQHCRKLLERRPSRRNVLPTTPRRRDSKKTSRPLRSVTTLARTHATG